MGATEQERLASQHAALGRLLRSEAWRFGERTRAFRAICEACSEIMGVARAGIWLYDEARASIRCVNLFERDGRSHSSGAVLLKEDYPEYFGALELERTIAADDAASDPRTCGFKSNYLEPLGIGALLDAPILVGGDCVGVVCSEHVGPVRDWSVMEEILAGSIADVAAMAIEADRSAQAREALVEKEQMLRMALQAGGVSTWIWTRGRPALRWSENAGHLFATADDRAPACWRGYLETLHPGDRASVLRELEGVVRAETDDYYSQHRLICGDGSTRWVEARGRAFRSRGRIVSLMGTLADVTAQKEAEEERLKLERRMLHAQKLESLGVLAGGIAHDFNNLLMGVLGNAEIAIAKLPPGSPALQQLEDIERTGRRAADLADQMLAYSGKGKLVLSSLDLSAVVREMSHLLEASIAKNVTLQLDLAPDLPLVEADATQIRQVVMNLITNASEAMGREQGTVTLKTRAQWWQADDPDPHFGHDELAPGLYAWIEVTDRGCGMSEQVMSRLFEPFFTTKSTGRGLGMAAALGIARGHRGTFRIYSKLGHGTTIRFMLPAIAAPPARPWPDQAGRGSWVGSGVVLLVDDEETVRNVGREMLRLLGFEVLLAEDGRAGIQLLRERRDEVDLVILDVTMPGLSGEDAFLEIREIAPATKVLLSSGHSEQEVTSRFAGQGLAGFLRKPYLLEDLRRKLRAALETEGGTKDGTEPGDRRPT